MPAEIKVQHSKSVQLSKEQVHEIIKQHIKDALGEEVTNIRAEYDAGMSGLRHFYGFTLSLKV